jgi:hypothetical protein
MAFVVMCGPTHSAPDRIVGPFELIEEATTYADEQSGRPDRYAVVQPLTPPLIRGAARDRA